MKNLICSDGREIKTSMIESLKLIPSQDFIGNSLPKRILFHPKGEKFFKKHFWSKPKPCDHNIYEYWDSYYVIWADAERIVKALKNHETNDDLTHCSTWQKYFNNDLETMEKQAEYNKEKDCVRRKTTIQIRTKSGDMLYAIFDNDEDAINTIKSFNYG